MDARTASRPEVVERRREVWRMRVLVLLRKVFVRLEIELDIIVI